MTPEDRLAADRATALEQIDDLSAQLADIVASTDLVATDDEHDPEGATIAFERARIDALRAAAFDHLAAIADAEARLAAGNYGACERCGQQISEARLEARPTATTCIDCAS